MLSSHSHWWEACFQIYSGKRSSGKKNAKLYLFCPVFFFFKYNKLNNMKFKKKKRIRLQCGRPWFDPWAGKMPWRRAWQPTPVFLPGDSTWTEVPGGLQSMGSQRVRHNWVTKHSTSILQGVEGGGRWKEGSVGEHICIPMADSC